MSVTILHALRDATAKVGRSDAQYLLAHLLGLSRAALIAFDDRLLSAQEAAQYGAQIDARERGHPVAQIIGEREFYGRIFHINAHVLIPRPETETLITLALAGVSKQKGLESLVDIGVLDLGTGSGAIAVTLACESPTLHITAVDKSTEAIALARINAMRHQAQIRLVESDWYQALAGERFHFIVSNPPYVAGNDAHLAQGDLRFEPRIALTDGSVDGLDAIRTIIAGAGVHLYDGGWLLFEHGYDQAARCRAMLENAGFEHVSSCNDLAGIARVTVGQYRNRLAAPL